MNNREVKIMQTVYRSCLYAHHILKIDKYDSIQEIKNLLDSLKLKKERYQTENEIIAEKNELKGSQVEIFELIYETFMKYGVCIHYDLKEIDSYYDELQYKFTDEENACHKARIKYLTE